MITPRFTCSQTESSVIVDIKAPAIRAVDVEIFVEQQTFRLHVNPYFLRLTFPCNLVEDHESSATYDPSAGELHVILSKETKGEFFKDLDLLSTLLAPSSAASNSGNPTIEVIDSDPATITERMGQLDLSDTDLKEAMLNDWQTVQQQPTGILPEASLKQFYGFSNLYSGYFRNVRFTENEVNELGDDPETISPQHRRELREQHEDKKFDEEYYLADFVNDEDIEELIQWNPFPAERDTVEFSEQQTLMLLNVSKREYLLSNQATKELYLALVNILFAYSYERRSTMSDSTSESAWTMSTLIPAFTALDTSPASSLTSTLVASYRRALSFPLYRSWRLCEQCRSDCGTILGKGRRFVLRCLLEMKDVLDHHDVYYIYSKIWLDDFCVWIQSYAGDEILSTLGHDVMQIKLEKALIGWDLEGLEAVALDVPSSDSDDESEDEVEKLTPTVL